MDIDPQRLPEDPALLRQMVTSLVQEAEARERRLRQLQHWLEQLLRARYGPRRERVEENQLFMFAAEIMARAEAGWKGVAAARWKIFVPHASPKDTAIDLTHSGKHVGSSAVRDFIRLRKPDATICGHIHEARGIDRIDGLPVVNCGPAGKGYYVVMTIDKIIELENRSIL